MVPKTPAALLKTLSQLKTKAEIYGPDAAFSCPVFHEGWADLVVTRSTENAKLTLIKVNRGGCSVIFINRTAYVSSSAVGAELDAIRAKP